MATLPEEGDSSPKSSIEQLGLAWLERAEQSRAEERAALQAILGEQLNEQKRQRRHKNLFRLFLALYLLALLWAGTADQWRSVELKSMPHKKFTAVVDIRGPIMAATNTSADNIIKGLYKAFEDPNSAGVIVRINSPGGSPVQSGQIYEEMTRLRARFPNKPFYAALEDLCASGGYYVAAAAPLIYADRASLVGSIGVILQGFGFQETLNKLGIESRLLTSGKNKAFLNPFAAVDSSEKSHAQSLLDKIHKQFIEAVRKGRGDRLKDSQAELFEGLIWTGEEAVQLGLVDGIGSTEWIARELIKQEKIVNFTQKGDWLTRISREMGMQ
ncbi:signal peptide peptidase SppA [Candidatus Magnetaquicoccus inordinatus]|uniref:signal peptide peptidase SppA n=1 Tax=Candidatus Magnetaquicoccus inordinatus TaxID=2496818 RepID=UPI00102CC414|nr:signal peptide peptidase SppA [Candidatus Magnetaquicoccus inordinatus]